MNVICWLIWLAVVIQNVAARQVNTHVKSRKSEPTVTETVEKHAELVSDTLNCPTGCNCQYAQFSALSTARWINHMKAKTETSIKDTTPGDAEENDQLYEVEDVDDLDNPYVKQATCILQTGRDAAALFNSLPMDLQVLVLLYTGVELEQKVNTSMLRPLYQLTTLEMRSASSKSMLQLIMDEPLSFLQYASFEQVRLLGSEKFNRAIEPIDPNEVFDYKPRVEYFIANEYGELQPSTADKVSPQLIREEEFVIWPYETLKKLRMPRFYGWSNLEVLRIHGCQLNEPQWQLFDGLTALQHLSLERNGIEKLPPFALYGALHIKSLSLAHNRLHKLHYRALGGLLELEVLDMRDNRLEKLSEFSFPPFPKLTRADFRNNPLRYILPATFWVMNETRVMHFGSAETALELWGNHVFDSLNKLHTLNIENVSINTLEQGVFKGLNSLVNLKLRGNIQSIEFDAFAGTSQLRDLDLSYCNIQELSMDALMGCKQIEKLNLAHNNISYIPPGFFDDQNQLKDVYLEHNQLSTLPHTFFQLPKLSLARLTDNPWHCTCEMHNWRPKVTNVIRGASTERCITDYMTGKTHSCRLVEHFKHDRSLSPRCQNFNGQSVRYVLRKRLQCDHVLNQRNSKRLNHSLPHWQKLERMRNKQPKAAFGTGDNKLSIIRNEQQQQQRRQVWSKNRNNIEAVLKRTQSDQRQTRQQNDNHEEDEALMTNEI